jgi:MFS family permease
VRDTLSTLSLRRFALYVGGFLGPFGTVLIVPMFPELRDEFDASSSAVSLGFSLYLVPFALALLFSGTIGERFGRRRTVRTTYALYAVASLAAAAAPTLGVFILARAVQGVANAFITPLLLAGLAEMVPSDRFGREVGIYSSFQAVGGGLGPLVGGLAADSSWQGAFIGTAVVAGLLALMPPDGEPRPGASAPQLRPLVTSRMVLLGLGFFFIAAGPVGIAVLVGVVARDVLDLSGTATGLILLGGAVAAMTLGPLWGWILDRQGAKRIAPPVILAATASSVALAFGRTGWTLGLLWIVGGAFAAFVVVVFQSLGATLLPDNRGGALSFLLSFRFLGHAAGPAVFVPVVDWSASATFVLAGGLGLITLATTSAALRDAAAD